MDAFGAGECVGPALEGGRWASSVEEGLAAVGGGLALERDGGYGILGGVGDGGLAWAGGGGNWWLESGLREDVALEAGIDDGVGIEHALAHEVHGAFGDGSGVDEALVFAQDFHGAPHGEVIRRFFPSSRAEFYLLLHHGQLVGKVNAVASLHADACGECAEGAGDGCAGGVELGALLGLLACLAVLLGGEEGVDLGVDEFVEADVGGLDGDIRSHAYGGSHSQDSADELGGFGSALLGADEVGGVSQAGD